MTRPNLAELRQRINQFYKAAEKEAQDWDATNNTYMRGYTSGLMSAYYQAENEIISFTNDVLTEVCNEHRPPDIKEWEGAS